MASIDNEEINNQEERLLSKEEIEKGCDNKGLNDDDDDDDLPLNYQSFYSPISPDEANSVEEGMRDIHIEDNDINMYNNNTLDNNSSSNNCNCNNTNIMQNLINEMDNMKTMYTNIYQLLFSNIAAIQTFNAAAAATAAAATAVNTNVNAAATNDNTCKRRKIVFNEELLPKTISFPHYAKCIRILTNINIENFGKVIGKNASTLISLQNQYNVYIMVPDSTTKQNFPNIIIISKYMHKILNSNEKIVEHYSKLLDNAQNHVLKLLK